MSKNRIFTEEELKEMGTPTLDQIMKAIDRGDGEEAKRLARRLQKEFNHLHDGYMVWVTGLLSYLPKLWNGCGGRGRKGSPWY